MEEETKEKAEAKLDQLKTVAKEGNWRSLYILGILILVAFLLVLILFLSIL